MAFLSFPCSCQNAESVVLDSLSQLWLCKITLFWAVHWSPAASGWSSDLWAYLQQQMGNGSRAKNLVLFCGNDSNMSQSKVLSHFALLICLLILTFPHWLSRVQPPSTKAALLLILFAIIFTVRTAARLLQIEIDCQAYFRSQNHERSSLVHLLLFIGELKHKMCGGWEATALQLQKIFSIF